MTTTELLRQQAADSGAEVIDWNFTSDRIKGLYCDGVIAVSDRLRKSAEQNAIRAPPDRCRLHPRSEHHGEPQAGVPRADLGVQPSDRADRDPQSISLRVPEPL